MKLGYSDTALKDLREIRRYIALDKPEAARKWVAKIRRICRLLAKNPELGDPRGEYGKGVRASYISHYVIYFRQEDSLVEILRVVRGDREMWFL